MALSAAGMAAGFAGLLAPIEGAILQEFIDLAAILNSLRMILPSGSLSDFAIPATEPTAESSNVRSAAHLRKLPTLNQHG
jgi:hypothetical protein